MPPRVPTKDDFTALQTVLPHVLHFPSPPESTVSILILFHGLGDSHVPFSGFARGMNLPGVLAISVRGTSPLPAALLPEGPGSPREGWHWGDDLLMEQRGGMLDDDPGFEKARRLVMGELVHGVLVEKCGWETSDMMLFGFGQGGSLALGLASRLSAQPRVTEVGETSAASHQSPATNSFKGVVSLGGPLPTSMVSTISSRQKGKTKICACQLDDDALDGVRREFDDVKVVQWKRREVAMPRDRDEMLPLMKFFADRLNSGW